MIARITENLIDHLESPASGQQVYRDDKLRGFGVRITASGVKSFIVEKRIGSTVRRKTLGRTSDLTVKDARTLAQTFLGSVAKGIDPVAEQKDQRIRSVTLQEVFNDYLTVRKTLKPNTVHDYRRIMRENFSDWLQRPLQTITKDKVAKRHLEIGQRSPARANNSMRVLRALFNFAAGQYEDSKGRGLFQENPVGRLSHTRAWYRIERRRTWIRPTDMSAWYQGVMSLTDQGDSLGETVRDYLLFTLFTGLRKTEGLTLTWDNVDLQERSFIIPDTKNREPHILPLSDFLHELLSKRQETRLNEFIFAGTGRRGHLIEPHRQIQRVIQQSGVKFGLHDLRRTFITIAEGLDISAYALKRLLNHKMRHDVTAGYIMTDVNRLRAPMQQITDQLLSYMTGTGNSNVVPLPLKTKRG